MEVKMPASNFNLYNMKHARNNFDAMRPAPVYNEAYQTKGQKVHISTNCYHGFHQQKTFDKSQDINDWEMQETSVAQGHYLQSSQTANMRKRSADDDGRPQAKRFREGTARAAVAGLGDGIGNSTNSTNTDGGGSDPLLSALPIPTHAAASSSASSNIAVVVHPPKQRPMSAYLKKNLSSQEKERLDKTLLNMIALDCQPFSIVDDEGFKTFVHGLNPCYELPSRKNLSTSILTREYEFKLTAVKSLVNAYCSSMCITVDCWTSRTMQPYMAITGHFINNSSLNFTSILLQCSPLDGSHTGENIAAAIKLSAQEWNISNKINFFVSDNASNMESAAILLSWPHYGCYAHKLNLIAQHALSIPAVVSTILKVQKTVAHFKRSSLAKEKLIKYQIRSQDVAEGSALNVIISVPTRWNSTFLMLQRFLVLQEAIKATVPNLNVDLPILPLEEWNCLEQYCTVLKPLYEATLIMSAENYLTASKAIVITQGLLAIYREMSENKNYYDPVHSLIKSVYLGLTSRFGTLENNMPLAVCTLLDPRFKSYGFQNEEAFRATKNFITTQILGSLNIQEEEPVPHYSAVSSAPTFALWDLFDKKISSATQPRSVHTKFKEEFEMYLNQALIGREECSLEWWRNHKTIYPSLHAFFIKNCNIIVTSVPCERAFSKAGNIINDRRTRLTTSKVTKLMFLHGNKHVN